MIIEDYVLMDPEARRLLFKEQLAPHEVLERKYVDDINKRLLRDHVEVMGSPLFVAELPSNGLVGLARVDLEPNIHGGESAFVIYDIASALRQRRMGEGPVTGDMLAFSERSAEAIKGVIQGLYPAGKSDRCEIITANDPASTPLPLYVGDLMEQLVDDWSGYTSPADLEAMIRLASADCAAPSASEHPRASRELLDLATLGPAASATFENEVDAVRDRGQRVRAVIVEDPRSGPVVWATADNQWHRGMSPVMNHRPEDLGSPAMLGLSQFMERYDVHLEHATTPLVRLEGAFATVKREAEADFTWVNDIDERDIEYKSRVWCAYDMLAYGPMTAVRVTPEGWVFTAEGYEFEPDELISEPPLAAQRREQSVVIAKQGEQPVHSTPARDKSQAAQDAPSKDAKTRNLAR